MFSQACVKDSVHRGGGVSQHALEQTPPQGSGRYVSYWNAFLLGNRNSRFEYLYASVYKFCVNFDAGSVLSKMFGIIWAGIQGKREAVYSLPSFLDYAKVSTVRWYTLYHHSSTTRR